MLLFFCIDLKPRSDDGTFMTQSFINALSLVCDGNLHRDLPPNDTCSLLCGLLLHEVSSFNYVNLTAAFAPSPVQ